MSISAWHHRLSEDCASCIVNMIFIIKFHQINYEECQVYQLWPIHRIISVDYKVLEHIMSMIEFTNYHAGIPISFPISLRHPKASSCASIFTSWLDPSFCCTILLFILMPLESVLLPGIGSGGCTSFIIIHAEGALCGTDAISQIMVYR